MRAKRCQVPGCQNTATRRMVGTDDICRGVHTGQINFLHCGHHANEELQETFNLHCEKEAEVLQDVNPFCEVEKSAKIA